MQSLLRQPKRLTLLTYLATDKPYEFHRRDRLAGLFWPEYTQDEARRALRQAVYVVRRELGEDSIVSRGDGELALAKTAVSCDVVAFAEALRTKQLRKALELYRGEFLEGLFVSEAPELERWIEDQRVSIREMAAGAAWSLAHQYLVTQELVPAVRTAQRALTLAPTDESEARRFIDALAAAGDRAAAISIYERFARRLDEDYDLEPMPETRALVDAIRSRTKPTKVLNLAEDLQKAASNGAVTGGRTVASRTGTVLGVVAAVAVLVTVAVVTLLPQGNIAVLDPAHVVVTVFRNETGDPSLDQFGSRTGHWITQGLQQAAVPVTPWDVSIQTSEYVEAEVEAGRVRNRVVALAAETGASVVISGAVYLMEGDSLEVQVNVTDPELGKSLGSIDPVRGSRVSASRIIADVQQQVMGFLAVRYEERLRGWAPNVIGEAPTFTAFHAFSQALEAHGRRDNAEAIRHYRRAFELSPTWAQPLIRMTSALNNLGRLTERDSVLEVLERLGDRLTPYERAEVLYQQAIAANDREGILAAVRRAARLAPGSPAVSNLAYFALEQNRPREALEALRAIDPERGWFRGSTIHWYLHVRAHHMLGENDRALEVARQADRHLPDGGAYILQLQARTLANLGRVEELDNLLDEIALAPDVGWVRIAMTQAVQALRVHGHMDAAATIATRVIDWFETRPLDETMTPGHRSRYGMVLFLANRRDEAQDVFDALVAEFPEDMALRGMRGFVAASRGDTALAHSDMEWFDSAVRPDGFMLLTLWPRGIIAGGLGDHGRAVELIRQATSQRGWDYELYPRTHWLHDPLRDYQPFEELMRPKG
jgi:serine/threonine-protein kinase